MIRLLDHALIVLLLVVAPAWGAREYRWLVREIRGGNTAARLREYRSTVLLQWGLSAALLTWWWYAGRSLSPLGLALPMGIRTLVGVVLTAVLLGLLAMQWRAISRLEGSGLDRLRRQVVSVAELMPHTEQEYRWFKILSVTAGICEELVFRGFMIWYLAHWMPMWLAAIAGGVVFGLAHWYQGTAGVIKTGITGIVMGMLYVATGSLLWPAILHAAIDLQGGAAGRKVLLSPQVSGEQ